MTFKHWADGMCQTRMLLSALAVNAISFNETKAKCRISSGLFCTSSKWWITWVTFFWWPFNVATTCSLSLLKTTAWRSFPPGKNSLMLIKNSIKMFYRSKWYSNSSVKCPKLRYRDYSRCAKPNEINFKFKFVWKNEEKRYGVCRRTTVTFDFVNCSQTFRNMFTSLFTKLCQYGSFVL